MGFSSSSLHFPIKIFLLILILNTIADEKAEYVTNGRQINNTEINYYDSAYPYEKLLELVNETKRILISDNATEKRRMLKLNPEDYLIYLRSNNLDGQPHRPEISLSSSEFEIINPDFENVAANAGPPPPSHKDASSNMANCRTVTKVHKPHRQESIDGSDQFILNVGKHFVQEWRITNCLRPGIQCGNPSTWPELYAAVCRQNYRGTAKFFSVPVGQEITLSQQKLREFRVPDGCSCELIAN